MIPKRHSLRRLCESQFLSLVEFLQIDNLLTSNSRWLHAILVKKEALLGASFFVLWGKFCYF